MARTSENPLKEFLGIPINREDKRRLRRVAKEKDRSPTELARSYIVKGAIEDERELGLLNDQPAVSK